MCNYRKGQTENKKGKPEPSSPPKAIKHMFEADAD